MNNKGFTLTELLAVIVLIAIISTIAGFSYNKIIKDNKIKQCEQKILYIEKQAVKYVTENPSLLHDISEMTLNVNKLVCNGYLEAKNSGDWWCAGIGESITPTENDEGINPIDGKKFDKDITITKTNGLVRAEYGGTCE